MKIAFIILAHRNPAQLERLLKKLAHPYIDCYVHIDAKCRIEEWRTALAQPRTFTVSPRTDIKWAGYSMVEATLQCMEAVRASGIHYNYVTLSSGQDYPIKPVHHIYEYLSAPSDKQYIGLISDEELQPMLSKTSNYHLVEYTFPGKYKLAELFTRLMPTRKVPLGMRLYSGSQWWSLTQDCVNYLLDHISKYPAIRRFFKFTWGPDEFIFQTLLMNSHYREAVTGYDLHYIDWSAGKEHPKDLVREDIENLLASPLLLARKFNLDKDPGTLDLLDARLQQHNEIRQ